MTTPSERTRALRYGHELLIEFDAADNLSPVQRDAVKTILESYPTGAEIEKWALDCVASGAVLGPMLAPETDHNPVPASLDRGPTAPRDHTKALRQAHAFFLKMRHADNPTADQQRGIAVVLRHFPDGYEIDLLVRQATTAAL